MIKIRFESTECGRCGGTGEHSYNEIDGTRCYGCGGTTRVLTKNGRRARDAYNALIDERCTKPVTEVKVGDRIWQRADGGIAGIPPMFRRSGFYEVTNVESDRLNSGYVSIDFTPDPKTGEPRGVGYAATMRVRYSHPEAEAQIMREVARKYSGAALISNEAEDLAFAKEQAARDAEAQAKRQAREEREAAKQAKIREEREAKERTQAETWRAANPDLVAYFEQCNPETFNTTYHGSMYHHAMRVRAGAALSASDTKWVKGWIERDNERKAKAATTTHFGQVGAKVTVTATLDKRINMGGSRFGTKYKVVMTEQTTGAKLISWTTADWPWNLDEGDTFTATATIDKHGEFRGERETEIKNVRLKK